jgi:hypothetical protein
VAFRGGVPAKLAQGGCQTFTQTGKTVCGKFLTYWQQHGGLAQQGYPISNTFTEVSDLNGKSRWCAVRVENKGTTIDPYSEPLDRTPTVM